MPLRLWFDLAAVLHLAETSAAARQRVDIDGNVTADAPPALHLMRDRGGDLDDRLYIAGNFHPSLSADDVNAEPFRSTRRGRRYSYGITWTEWLGRPPREASPVQARIALRDDARLLDLLRAGHAAGYDMFTIDIDAAGLRPAVARRRLRVWRSGRAPRAGASHHARPAQAAPYTSSRTQNRR
ncbi:hypothetical protein [Micromonospora globbae]|uniref:hypothetical protein n=1 Tax=Micromonospora globbae TaxID=1894969 RepID=UPI00343978F0